MDEKQVYKNEEHKKGVVNIAVPEDFHDLSLEHSLLGSLTGGQTRLSPEEWRQCELSKEQVEEFWERGFLTNVRVLTDEQCDQIIKDYQQFLDPDKLHPGHGLFYEFHRNQSGSPDNVLLHALGQWRITPTFHDLCFLPSIAVPASQLIHPSKVPTSIRLWHDQLFAKPPKHGGVVAWHQDYSYWTRTKPMQHITVHVALDDQTVETGGLHYIPGSHRWHRNGMPLPITDASFGKMTSIEEVLTDEERENFKPVPSNLKRGEASFHHPLMVHGSYANSQLATVDSVSTVSAHMATLPLTLSERPRRAAVVNFIADGVMSDTDESVLNGVPVINKGKKMEGQFFPVVYNPGWSRGKV